MKIELLGPAQFKSQSWKNGGGSTLELYKYPDQEDYDLRLSIATVSASGAFSKFPGYQRTIIQLEGAPMKLIHTDLNQTKILDRFSPYNFDGDLFTDCQVSDTARDFNVIYKKSASVDSSVINLETNEKKILPAKATKTIMFCLSGQIMVENLEIPSSLVSERELCILTREAASKQISVTAGKNGASLIVILKD